MFRLETKGGDRSPRAYQLTWSRESDTKRGSRQAALKRRDETVNRETLRLFNVGEMAQGRAGVFCFKKRFGQDPTFT